MERYETITITENTINLINNIDPMMFLNIQYNADYQLNQPIGIINQDNQLLAVGVLVKTNTWDYSCTENHLTLEIAHTDSPSTKWLPQLIETLKHAADHLQLSFPEKQVSVKYHCLDTAMVEQDVLFKSAFRVIGTTPVFKYHLSETISPVVLEQKVTIELLVIDEQSAELYHQADYLANQGEARTKEQLLFRSNNPTFKCYVALIDSQIVGSLSSWQINEQRFTTEDIFVLPTYRGKGIAKSLLTQAINDIRSLGGTEVTLSTEGTNTNAINLYLSYGYQSLFNFITFEYKCT